MIRCVPDGFWSWNFHLTDEYHEAILEFNWFGEAGTITVDGVCFDVCKQGAFSGHWTLERDGLEIASAERANIFTRTFEISDAIGSLLLRAESVFGRSFVLELSNEVIATITPDHAFTRRTTIEVLEKSPSFPTLAFAFWLVVLTWRRQAQDNS
jgi:hypothetical protein